jgi:hypothetical protein
MNADLILLARHRSRLKEMAPTDVGGRVLEERTLKMNSGAPVPLRTSAPLRYCVQLFTQNSFGNYLKRSLKGMDKITIPRIGDEQR